MWFITGAICLLVFSWIILKVNKRIPASFFINIILYTVSFIFRNVNEILREENIVSNVDIITNTICVSLVEISLAYFVF